MNKPEGGRRGHGPRTDASPDAHGRDGEGNKQEDGRDEQADFIPLEVCQNRKAMRGVPTVDDWLVSRSTVDDWLVS